MAEGKNPLDQALDVLFFAPVGLLLTARQELPNLAEKGRERVTGQVALARMVGRFAVVQGQKEAGKATSRLVKQANEVVSQFGAGAGTPEADPFPGATPARPPTGVTGSSPTPHAQTAVPQSDFKVTGPGPGAGRAEDGGEVLRAPTNGRAGVSSNGFQTGAAAGAVASAEAEMAVPDAGTLAIPGYDALSASQVVQRLAGLAPVELDAVGRYESATRGRRTILSKVAQLQAGD